MTKLLESFARGFWSEILRSIAQKKSASSTTAKDCPSPNSGAATDADTFGAPLQKKRQDLSAGKGDLDVSFSFRGETAVRVFIIVDSAKFPQLDAKKLLSATMRTFQEEINFACDTQPTKSMLN